MTTYSFGDVILIEFPHTNLQTISKRPAIILYDSGDKDVLAARITTQEHKTKTDHKIIKWKECGLLTESYIRLGKQATIEKRYIIRKLGALDHSEIQKLKTNWDTSNTVRYKYC